MSFAELRDWVEKKNGRIKDDLNVNIGELRKTREGEQLYSKLTAQTLDDISEYLVHTSRDHKNSEEKYYVVRNNLNNLYHKTLELTHKLHWFRQIYNRLRAEADRRSSTKHINQQDLH